MPHDIPWEVRVQEHPGSSAQAIQDEPDWGGQHQHRVGFKNRQDRRPGLTHAAEDDEELVRDEKEAEQEHDQLISREKSGELVNFRDMVENEKDFHLRYPDNKSIGWRYVLECTEDWVKNTEEWPANVKKRQKQQAAEQEKQSHTSDGVKMVNGDSQTNGQQEQSQEQSQEEPQEENDWKRQNGENSKHHDAYAGDDGKDEDSEHSKSDYDKLLERYTPQEIALLRALQHEKDYRYRLKQNDGKQQSPQTQNRTTIAIDEADQFTPDNWLPRSDHLIRLTGKHPLNAESELTTLYEGGLITPNELHYVRNHGAVPRLLWEFHELDVADGALVLSMDDLKQKFEAINIPVSLACDGNRRKELNMIKKSKGFNWGSGELVYVTNYVLSDG